MLHSNIRFLEFCLTNIELFQLNCCSLYGIYYTFYSVLVIDINAPILIFLLRLDRLVDVVI